MTTTEIVIRETITPPDPAESTWFATESRASARASWKGDPPPPAALRCSGLRSAVYASGWKSHGVCMERMGHTPPCVFCRRGEVSVRDAVIASIREVLETGVFDDDTALVALGDSLALVAIVFELEERLHLQIPDGTELAWTSVGDVVRWAEGATERRPS